MERVESSLFGNAHPPLENSKANETKTNKQVAQEAGAIDIIYYALAHHPFAGRPGGSAWSHLLPYACDRPARRGTAGGMHQNGNMTDHRAK